MNINTATNVAKANLNGKENRMNRQSITTVALSLMIIAAISISTVSSAAAQSTTPDQIHDHQELAEYHGGTLRVAGPVMVEGAKPFDMIANRAELAAYQSYLAGQPTLSSEESDFVAMK